MRNPDRGSTALLCSNEISSTIIIKTNTHSCNIKYTQINVYSKAFFHLYRRTLYVPVNYKFVLYTMGSLCKFANQNIYMKNASCTYFANAGGLNSQHILFMYVRAW